MKVLASDYDGTLRVNNDVSIQNIEAIKRWRATGNVFGIITGRSVPTILQQIQEYQVEVDFIVCNNGGIMIDDKGVIIEKTVISEPIVGDVIKTIKTLPIEAYELNNGYGRARCVLNEQAILRKSIPNMSETELLQEGGVSQMVLQVKNVELAFAVAEQLNTLYSNEIEAFANLLCVDIVAKDVNKAQGMIKVAKMHKYPLDRIYTIGDADNDLSMLTMFHGATLRHADKAIQAQVKYVVDDVASYIRILELL